MDLSLDLAGIGVVRPSRLPSVAPQDEGGWGMPSKMVLILRRFAERSLEGRMALFAAIFLLAGCHGGTLDAVYPGELGHSPPPTVNLPPQDAGMERL